MSEPVGERGAAPARLLDILKKAEDFLAQKGCPAARLDAQLLLAHVLRCDRVRLYVDYGKPLTDGELAAYRELIRRRATREPVAYLLGEREFWSLPLKVDARVLIPRPDSETLIEEAQACFASGPPGSFADIGTGSGCLAAALATEFPAAVGLAVDRAADAADLARENLAQLGLAGRVQVVVGHLVEPLATPVDLLVANLPYIPSADLPGLPSDVRLYEPPAALDGGADGLALLRPLIAAAPGHLCGGGWLLLEVGEGQAEAVAGLCRAAGLAEVHTRSDLAGVQRVVAGRRGNAPTLRGQAGTDRSD